MKILPQVCVALSALVIVSAPLPALAQQDTTTTPTPTQQDSTTTPAQQNTTMAPAPSTASDTGSNDDGFDLGWLGLLGLLGLAGLRRRDVTMRTTPTR